MAAINDDNDSDGDGGDDDVLRGRLSLEIAIRE